MTAVAHAKGALRDRVEDRLGVGRRAGDRPQDLAGRRLLLERLGQLPVPRLELREQPHVLDRDHRLVGEGLEERDLLVGERPRPPSRITAMTPIGASLPQHGHRQERCESPARASSSRTRARPGPRRMSAMCDDRPSRIAPGRQRVRGPAASGYTAPSCAPAPRPTCCSERRGGSARRRSENDRAESAVRTADRALARSRRRPAARRSASSRSTRRISPVAVCCSSASVSSRFRASSSVNSRTFSIAITAWSAKVFSSSICLSVERNRLRAPEQDHADRHPLP